MPHPVRRRAFRRRRHRPPPRRPRGTGRRRQPADPHSEQFGIAYLPLHVIRDQS
jgi:hypothetical protein